MSEASDSIKMHSEFGEEVIFPWRWKLDKAWNIVHASLRVSLWGVDDCWNDLEVAHNALHCIAWAHGIGGGINQLCNMPHEWAKASVNHATAITLIALKHGFYSQTPLLLLSATPWLSNVFTDAFSLSDVIENLENGPDPRFLGMLEPFCAFQKPNKRNFLNFYCFAKEEFQPF